jgi:signal-transduction protein with cAMP-binding, CBS, and nucleotidyltransferase domain
MESVKYDWEPICVAPDQGVIAAADQMDDHGVGCVVVADAGGSPCGIVTDRDLARRVVAAGRDPDATRVADVMTPNPVTAKRGAPVAELLETMRKQGVRRIPLVDSGKVVALVSFDDLVLTLSVQLWNLSEGIREELRETWRTSARRRRHEAREELMGELRDRLLGAGEDLRGRAAGELRALAKRLEGH